MENSVTRNIIVINSDKSVMRELTQSIIDGNRLTDEYHLLVVVPQIPALYLQLPSICRAEIKKLNRMRTLLSWYGKFFDIPPERLWLRSGDVSQQRKWLSKQLLLDGHQAADNETLNWVKKLYHVCVSLMQKILNPYTLRLLI